jgi:hypothetical protein
MLIDLDQAELEELLEHVETIMTADIDPPDDLEGEALRQWVIGRLSPEAVAVLDARRSYMLTADKGGFSAGTVMRTGWTEEEAAWYRDRAYPLVAIHRKIEIALEDC